MPIPFAKSAAHVAMDQGPPQLTLSHLAQDMHPLWCPSQRGNQWYPLVNIQKTMENHHVYPWLMGKSTINVHFPVRYVSLPEGNNYIITHKYVGYTLANIYIYNIYIYIRIYIYAYNYIIYGLWTTCQLGYTLKPSPICGLSYLANGTPCFPECVFRISGFNPQDKGKISSHDGISTMFQTDSEWWSVLHVCHGRLLHGRGMVIPLPFFLFGIPPIHPYEKWPLPPYLVGGWAYPSEKSESQYESVGMMTFPIYGKIIQMFQTTNQWWSCGKPRHVLTMALAFQLSNLP